MTTRITVAILLVTWTIIIVCFSAAFVTARESLLQLLDESVTARASAVLDYNLNPRAPIEGFVPTGDTYVIRDASDKLLREFKGEEHPEYHPQVVRKAFETHADGERYRTVTINAMRVGASKDAPAAATIVYSRPAGQFDRQINYLLAVLSSLGMFCGLATGWVALKVSRAALRPLTETANVIADIDEMNLTRRIDVEALPIELVPMTNRLNEMLERLQRVFSQRKQFLADAAHELRTPTAALLTTLEVTLRRQRDPRSMSEAMQSALADARLLRRLVDKLMEQARSDHAAEKPASELLDFAELLRNCVSSVKAIAEEKHLTIDQDFPDELVIMTQRDRLQSIVLNLLSNAIEYNRDGGVVHVRVEDQDQGLQLSIRDSGHGICADHLPHVFEPFYRAHRETQGDTQHLGLGLFLVQSHVRSLGGTCRIDSEAGVGTTVHIMLPVKAVAHRGRFEPQPSITASR